MRATGRVNMCVILSNERSYLQRMKRGYLYSSRGSGGLDTNGRFKYMATQCCIPRMKLYPTKNLATEGKENSSVPQTEGLVMGIVAKERHEA